MMYISLRMVGVFMFSFDVNTPNYIHFIYRTLCSCLCRYIKVNVHLDVYVDIYVISMKLSTQTSTQTSLQIYMQLFQVIFCVCVTRFPILRVLTDFASDEENMDATGKSLFVFRTPRSSRLSSKVLQSYVLVMISKIQQCLLQLLFFTRLFTLHFLK